MPLPRAEGSGVVSSICFHQDGVIELPAIQFRGAADSCLANRHEDAPHAILLAPSPGDSKPYAAHIDSYADSHDADPSRVCPEPLSDWLSKHEHELRSQPFNRPLTFVVSHHLLPLVSAEPAHWGAVPYLNSLQCPAGEDSFVRYVDSWRQAAPSIHHPFIDQIIRLVQT